MDSTNLHRRGLLLVLSAPSGGGKSVVLRRLLEAEPDVIYSISVTSRPPRGEERDGHDYFFVSRDEFEEMIDRGEFYEWAEVHGHLYGTRAAVIQAACDLGRDVALDIDVQGALGVKRLCPDAVLVFLMPPSIDVLEQRLRGRATDGEAQIQLRLANARREMQHWAEYDYLVVNDSLDETVRAVAEILHAERRRASRIQSASPRCGSDK